MPPQWPDSSQHNSHFRTRQEKSLPTGLCPLRCSRCGLCSHTVAGAVPGLLVARLRLTPCAQSLGCLLPASRTAGEGKGLAGYMLCISRNRTGIRRNRSAVCTLLCSACNSKEPRGDGLMATRLFPACLFVVFIKPRNGPDENRKGEQAPARRRLSRGRKPQQEAVGGICSLSVGPA